VKKPNKFFSSFFKKNLLFLIVVGILIILEAFLFLLYGGGVSNIASYFKKSNPNVTGILLFYGNNCLHCVNVDNFIKNNKVEDKVKFTKLEVFNNVKNSNILADKAQICGINPQQIGVPFLWDGKNCIIGDVDVIKFFQQKITKKP